MNPAGGTSTNPSLGVIILAAGEGTRMKSRLPKVLQPLMGKPMIIRLLPNVLSLDPARVVLVIGHGAGAVKDAVLDSGFSGRMDFVVQEEQLGTGHAVGVTQQALRDSIEAGKLTHLLVLNGDNPLTQEETLQALVDACSQGVAATVLTIIPEDRRGYGRIIRNTDGTLQGVVEERDASEEQEAITEVNAGSYCFDARKLFAALQEVRPDNARGEYYLTDVLGVLVSSGETVHPVRAANERETMGLDSREKLATAHAILRDTINRRWMSEGVFIEDPGSTWIEPEVELGRDVTLLPGTWLKGLTRVAEGATVGPYSMITDSTIGEEAVVSFAVIDDSTVGAGAEIGPYCRLRGGTVIEQGAKVGTFVEAKNTRLGEGSKIPHLSYFGDAEVGVNVNVGAGSITCNFDGNEKHKTVIDDDVFVGSDTMLVAPVRLGAGSGTGAGSVVNKDVAPGDLVVGSPAQFLRRRNIDLPDKKEGTLH